MPGLDDWLSVARSAEDDELRERILTGSTSGKPFTPYVPTVELPPDIDWLLDFGCGIGRNFPYLRTIARQVAGFDLPPMIERCRTLAPVPADLLLDDWNEVRQRRFDVIVATLVLQHIETAACRTYAEDFARIAPVVYLLTRAQSDFGANVLDLVDGTALFDVQACVKVEHDPRTHQLQVLGRIPFEEARQSPEEAHYELLLRSRLRSKRVGA